MDGRKRPQPVGPLRRGGCLDHGERRGMCLGQEVVRVAVVGCSRGAKQGVLRDALPAGSIRRQPASSGKPNRVSDGGHAQRCEAAAGDGRLLARIFRMPPLAAARVHRAKSPTLVDRPPPSAGKPNPASDGGHAQRCEAVPLTRLRFLPGEPAQDACGPAGLSRTQGRRRPVGGLTGDGYTSCVRRESQDRRRLNAQANGLTTDLLESGAAHQRRPPKGQAAGRRLQ